MQEFMRQHIKVVIGISITIFVGLIAWGLIYTFVIFHVTSVTPSGTISHLQPRLVVTFNKDLSQDGLDVRSDDISSKASVDGNKLTVNFDNYMEVGQTYSVVIGLVMSDSGDKIENHVIRFTASDDDSLLSEEDVQIVLDRQDNKTGLYNDPIYQYLPYSTLDYEIIPSGGTDTGEKASIQIVIELSAADAKSGRSAAVATYKQRAIEYLSNLEGIDISQYKITTTVVDPVL
jgi:hypothetical protein